MKLNEFCHEVSEYSHVVQMFRNYIAKEHFVSKLVKSVSNSQERVEKYGRDLMSNAKYEATLHPHTPKQ